MKLLLIEDEIGLAEALKEILEKENYSVDVFYNGADGLGLAIAKAIADEHKGKILVESKQGEWARFTVVLN